MIKRILVTAAIVAAVATPAVAQDWPAKPIRVIVPLGAGSAPDIVPRIVLDQVGKQIGQTFIIENRPGAGQTTGTAAVARSDPDGYTLLATSNTHAAGPALYPNLPYNAAKDFAGIAQFGLSPMSLVVRAEAPHKNVAEFVTFAKGAKNPLNFGTSGAGTSLHLAAERFRLSAGYQATMVPFKGSAEALTEVIAGRIDFCFCPVGSSIELIRSGKLRSLAVSPTVRVHAIAEVPTTTELGYKDSDYGSWLGMLAPRATPRPILERMAREIGSAMKVPSVAARLAPNGIQPTDVTLEAFDALIARDIEVHINITKAISLRAN